MKTKILFLIESFALGGAERVLVDIANNFDRDLFDVSVISIFKRSVYSNYRVEVSKHFKPHITYRFLVNNDFKILFYLFNFLLNRVPSLIYALFIGDKYDIVIAFYEGAPTHFISNAKLKRGRKVAWLHTSTSLSQKGKSKASLEDAVNDYKNFEKIVAVSHGVADSFVLLFPDLVDKVCVAYNPIDIDVIKAMAFEPVSISKPDCPLFVSVGRLVNVKGYDRYLRVINKLNSEGYSFKTLIVGGGDSSQFKSYCIENQLNSVCFLGHKDNPYPYMSMADWIIVPSYVEGLGLVVLEGLVLNKAILMTNCSSTSELLGASEFGLVADNSEDGLYDAMKMILNNPSLKVQYEKKAESRSHFLGLRDSMDRIISIINDVL